MNKRRIALVFEGLQEVHLHKDVGMIPYVLARDFQYESEILFLKDKNNSGLEVAAFSLIFRFSPGGGVTLL